MTWDLTKDVSIIHRDFDNHIRFFVLNSENQKIDFTSWQLKLYGDREQVISEDPTLLTRVGEAEFDFFYEAQKYKEVYELFLSVAGNRTEGTYFYNRLIKPVSVSVLRNIIVLRNQIDKAMKSLGKTIDELQYFDNKEALDSFWKDFPIGYSDQHCVFYLELGLSMINLIAPYTAFTLSTFPYSVAQQILIDAATIVALESQGIFSIDTDFDYSLGGKSLTVRHFDNISAFLRDISDRFNTNVRIFKSAFRTKGTVLLQQPYGLIGFRLIQLAPTWLARFGLGVQRWT